MFDDLKVLAANKDLRTCVIENSIFIEELASKVLGDILHIDWATSRSFGHGSSSLSFFQKLQLIQDIKGLAKEDLKKITCLANIRNKFAHVSHIDTFEKLFVEPGVGKEIRNNFLGWYFDKDGFVGISPSKMEFVNRICFFLLVNDVINIMVKIFENHSFDEGFREGEAQMKKQLLDFSLSIMTDDQRKGFIEKFKKFQGIE